MLPKIHETLIVCEQIGNQPALVDQANIVVKENDDKVALNFSNKRQLQITFGALRKKWE